MRQNSFYKKRILHIYILVLIVLILFLTAGLFMIKYNVEGEKNLPFNLKKISIISTAESDITQDEEENWHAGILQKNDVFFTIEKNKDYKKSDTIKEIKLENFKIEKLNENANVDIYRPRSNEFNYSYVDEYKIENSLVIIGGQESNQETLQINNQGGTIGISIAEDNLGEYNFTVNEKVPSDGKLLAKAGLKTEDIEFKISFDLIIETGSENKFKANIILDLPTGNILEEGVSTEEIDNTENIVFKRIK